MHPDSRRTRRAKNPALAAVTLRFLNIPEFCENGPSEAHSLLTGAEVYFFCLVDRVSQYNLVNKSN